MHAETAQHITLLHYFFIEHYDASKPFDFVEAYQAYKDARLQLVGINFDDVNLKPILPILKFAIGASRTGSPERGAQVLAMTQALPECVKEILFTEFETKNLNNSIYMLNIVALTMGPFFPIAPKVKEGMTVGLCLAAYLFAETRKYCPAESKDEFKANASQIADLFTTKVTPDIKDKIVPLYDLLKNITDIQQVATHVQTILKHDIKAVPATNGVRFLSKKIEVVEQKLSIDSLANTELVDKLFSPKVAAPKVENTLSAASTVLEPVKKSLHHL